MFNRLMYLSTCLASLFCAQAALSGAEVRLHQRLELVFFNSLDNLISIQTLLQVKPELVHARQRGTQDTALHIVSRRGAMPEAQKLLRQGARIDERNASNHTAFHETAKHGHIDLALLLLNWGADEKLTGGKDPSKTGLLMAAEYGHDHMVRTLLDRQEIDISQKKAVLHRAAQSGKTAVVCLLLDKEVPVDAVLINDNQNTALHKASMNGHKEVIRLLLSRSAKVNAKNGDEQQPLHLAAKAGHTTIVQLLLDEYVGTDINAQDSHGDTALHIATAHGHRKTILCLLDRGADIHKEEYDGNETALVSILPISKDERTLHLTRTNRENLARLLVARGAKVPDRYPTDTTEQHAFMTELRKISYLRMQMYQRLLGQKGLPSTVISYIATF